MDARGQAPFDRASVEDEILRRIADGEPLLQICRDKGMPSKSVVYRWCEEGSETYSAEFAGRFTRARKEGFDAIAEEALEIADTTCEGVETVEKATGTETRRGDMLGHRKLQVETRLKLLAKWDPKRYGEKVAVGGADDLPPMRTVSDVNVSPEDAYKRMIGRV